MPALAAKETGKRSFWLAFYVPTYSGLLWKERMYLSEHLEVFEFPFMC